MTIPNGSPQQFQVRLSQHIADEINGLHAIAFQAGLGKAFVDALRMIHARLREDPRRFGDPLYRLPALQMLVYARAIFPILVDYGVHDDIPLVFIKGIRIFGIS